MAVNTSSNSKRSGVLSVLTRGQREWACRNKMVCDEDGYCLSASENMFQPLTEQSEQELRSGDAIESKFTEPYRASNKNRLKDAYFAAPVWRNVDLPGCQTLAEMIRDAPTFRYLDAAQLLKHMLGLARSAYPKWRLCYLWFEPSGDDGERHRMEVSAFSRMLASDTDRFIALTYQTLYRRLVESCGPEDAAYLTYLGDRYFDKAR